MTQNTNRNGFSPDTVLPSEFPVGSDESRMAARAVLQNLGGPPDIAVWLVKPVIANGEFQVTDGRLRETDHYRATCGGREWLRREGESLKEFKNRVRDDLPVVSRDFLIFWPDRHSSDGDATNAQRQS